MFFCVKKKHLAAIFVSRMKVLLFVLLVACFAIVLADGAVVKTNVKSNVPATKKTVKATQKPSVASGKKQAKVVGKKTGSVVANLEYDPCSSLESCTACFGNSSCYYDTAALQCRSVSLVASNHYCPSSPSSSASIAAISSLLMALVAVFFL